MSDKQIEPLLRALIPIQDYLADGNIVISGGWVPIIYQRYVLPGKGQPSLLTTDVDVVIPNKLDSGERHSLRHLLLEDGFIEDFVGDANPPASCFRKEVGELNVELEFLTPLRGAKNNETLWVQSDLAAQALRYSDILLEEPMTVMISEEIDGKIVELTLFVPRPAAFVFQKGLAFTKRIDRIKKAKDLYYIFDIIAGYPEFGDAIVQGMVQFKADSPTWFHQFIKNMTKHFLDARAPAPRMIVEQRSESAYKSLNDAQLEQYCRSTMDDFVAKISG